HEDIGGLGRHVHPGHVRVGRRQWAGATTQGEGKQEDERQAHGGKLRVGYSGACARCRFFSTRSAFGEVAATLFGGTCQQCLMLVVESGPGAEAVAASDQSIARAGGEAVIFEAQLAVALQRFAVRADIGAPDLEAIATIQYAAAGSDLEIAIVLQAA